jgi:hypothetical protein
MSTRIAPVLSGGLVSGALGQRLARARPCQRQRDRGREHAAQDRQSRQRERERARAAAGLRQDDHRDQLERVRQDRQAGDPRILLQAVERGAAGRAEAVEDDEREQEDDQVVELLEAVLGVDPGHQQEQHDARDQPQDRLDRERPEVDAHEPQVLAAGLVLGGVTLEVDLEVAGEHRGQPDDRQRQREDAEPARAEPAQHEHRVQESRNHGREAFDRQEERAAREVLEHEAHRAAPAACASGRAEAA